MHCNEEFVCSVCLHYHHLPTAVAACSHVFCRSCIERCSLCPLCRTPAFSLVSARWTAVLMQRLRDDCGYCSFSGSLLAVGAHIKERCRSIHSAPIAAEDKPPSRDKQAAKKLRAALRDRKKRTAARVAQRQAQAEPVRADTLSQVSAFGRSLRRAVVEVEEAEASVIELD